MGARKGHNITLAVSLLTRYSVTTRNGQLRSCAHSAVLEVVLAAVLEVVRRPGPRPRPSLMERWCAANAITARRVGVGTKGTSAPGRVMDPCPAAMVLHAFPLKSGNSNARTKRLAKRLVPWPQGTL